MDKREIENIVREAREQVERGSICIERQRELLAKCEIEGLDLATAHQFLRILMEAQKLHVADCKSWERKLDNEQKTQGRSF